MLLRVYWYLFVFHNSLIIHGIIHQMMVGYFDLYFLFIIIKSDMKIAYKTVINLINEKIFPLKVSSLRQDV